MTAGPLVKAKITAIDPPFTDVECLFNPKEYQIQRSNNWGAADNSTKNAHDLTFSGSSGAKLTMQLFFDTYLTGRSSNSTNVKDVREYTDKLWQMMNIPEQGRDPKTQKGRPPRVLFTWGESWLFNAVITQMEQKYTMFMPNGIPVRAMVNIDFQEAVEHKSLITSNATKVMHQLIRESNPQLDLRYLQALGQKPKPI